MKLYVDIISGCEIGTDSYPTEEIADGAILAVDSKRITISDDVDIGDMDEVDSSVETVVNIVHSHELRDIALTKKEYKKMFKTSMRALIKAYKKKELQILEIKELPEDKDAAKAAIAAAEAKLSDYVKTKLAAIRDGQKSFKANFDKLQNFVKKTVVPNFDEFEFYHGDGADLGECLIIPARYIGEATSPTFYYFNDAILKVAS